MPFKDQAWGPIESVHADSTIERILKAVAFHAEPAGDHCSSPDKV